MIRPLRLTTTQRRSFISSLFGLTFLASVVTVAASSFLPCPARHSRVRYADGQMMENGGGTDGKTRKVIVEKRPSRWIREKDPQQ